MYTHTCKHACMGGAPEARPAAPVARRPAAHGDADGVRRALVLRAPPRADVGPDLGASKKRRLTSRGTPCGGEV